MGRAGQDSGDNKGEDLDEEGRCWDILEMSALMIVERSAKIGRPGESARNTEVQHLDRELIRP